MSYRLLSCVWELTLKCNLACTHCGSSAGRKRESELTLTECIGVAGGLINLKCKSVTLLGGEVFYYQGWEKIARKLSDGGVLVNLVTNGFSLSSEDVRKIKDAGITNVAVSVDGTKEVHDSIRNNTRSFERLTKTIKHLKAENIPVSVISTLTQQGLSDIENLYQYLVDCQVNDWQIQLVHPMGNASGHNDELLISPDKVLYLTGFIREKRLEQNIRIYAGDNIGYFDENEMYLRNAPGNLSLWDGCKAGISIIGIDSDGDVKGCQSLYLKKFVEGNLRYQGIESIWNNPDNFSYNRKFNVDCLNGNCKACEKGLICKGGCRASNYFINGNFFNNYYCNYNRKTSIFSGEHDNSDYLTLGSPNSAR
jgi:radical SAM protein with 4Fe4S-binding SPASM domain